MKINFKALFFIILCIISLCFTVFAADKIIGQANGVDLQNYLIGNNDYKDKDGTKFNCTITETVETGVAGKPDTDKSVHGYIAPQPVNDENYGSRTNHKQLLIFGTNPYTGENLDNKYVVFEANFLPTTTESIGTITLQPNAGLNISVTLTAKDNVIDVGRWNHIRFVSDPSTFDAEKKVYPYTYVYVNGKLVKEGQKASYNAGYFHLPFRFMSDAGDVPGYAQDVYFDDFKAYITDTKPAEYSMPTLYSDGKSTAIVDDILYVYEDTLVDDLKGTSGETIVVYDTVTFDYILPLGSKLYDGNLICVNGADGKISYYTVKKEVRNVADVRLMNDGFQVSANIKDSVLVAAGYDFNGVLKELLYTAEEGQKTLTISKDCLTAKGFVFKSLSSMTPLSPVASVTATPTIGIWGASITQGQGGSTSYPDVIAKLSGYNVYNLGIGGETQSTIIARQGGLDIKLTKDITIPASGSVDIEFAAYNKDDGKYAGVVTPRNTSLPGWNPITINGIEGTLSVVVNNDVWPRVLKSASFTRKGTGEAVTVPAGTIIEPDGLNYRTDITIFTVSSNGGWTSENTTAKDSQYEGLINLLDRGIANSKYPENFLIVGLTTQGDTAWVQVHRALKEKYGDKFYDVRSYLASEKALNDAGITPTATDLSLISQGHVPASFIANYPTDAVHFNDAGYTRMGEAVYNKLVELGYIDVTEDK